MNSYPTPHLLIAALFLLMLWTPVLAQEAQDVSDTTLSDEVLRQEVRDAVVIPCVDEAFTEMVKVAGLEEQVTVNDLKHALGPNVVQPTNEFVTNVVKQVRGEPDTVRKGWYKIALGVCMNMVKEKVRSENPLGTAVSRKSGSLAQSQGKAPAIPDRTKLWDQMKELDAIVNQQATEFEEMEQERLYAVERRQASVPEAVRQETLQQCKKKFERIEKAGFGGGSWSLLQSCVSNELDAYLDLKKTYGDSLSDGTDSTR